MNHNEPLHTPSLASASASPPAPMRAAMPTALDPQAPATMQQALARLELSRHNLREAFKPPPAPAMGSESAFLHPIRRARAWLSKTPWGGLLDPALGAAGQEIESWWEGQPWRQSAVLLKDTVSSKLLPHVRRHPLAAVVITALAGAVLARSGVWRWRPVRRSVSQLGTRVRRLFMNQIANPAIQSVLLAVLVAYLAPKRPAESDPGAAAREPEHTGAAAD